MNAKAKENEIYKFDDLADEEILLCAGEGNMEAVEYLIKKYKNFVRSKARAYFLIGADKEDIIQEGMIGLYKAIINYRPEKLTSFKSFAEICIRRQIITAVKTATRQKHIPLNSYVSFSKPVYEENADKLTLDVLSGFKISDPETVVIGKEQLAQLEKKIIEVLSPFEMDVLNVYLEGKSYQEISNETGREVKSVDNALQRIKKKLEKYLE